MKKTTKLEDCTYGWRQKKILQASHRPESNSTTRTGTFIYGIDAIDTHTMFSAFFFSSFLSVSPVSFTDTTATICYVHLQFQFDLLRHKNCFIPYNLFFISPSISIGARRIIDTLANSRFWGWIRQRHIITSRLKKNKSSHRRARNFIHLISHSFIQKDWLTNVLMEMMEEHL